MKSAKYEPPINSDRRFAIFYSFPLIQLQTDVFIFVEPSFLVQRQAPVYYFPWPPSWLHQ